MKWSWVSKKAIITPSTVSKHVVFTVGNSAVVYHNYRHKFLRSVEEGSSSRYKKWMPVVREPFLQSPDHPFLDNWIQLLSLIKMKIFDNPPAVTPRFYTSHNLKCRRLWEVNTFFPALKKYTGRAEYSSSTDQMIRCSRRSKPTQLIANIRVNQCESIARHNTQQTSFRIPRSVKAESWKR